MAVRDLECSDSVDMAGEGQLQLATCQVPELDGSVGRAGNKKLIHRIYGDAAHPASVATNHLGKLPWVMRPLDLLILSAKRDLSIVCREGQSQRVLAASTLFPDCNLHRFWLLLRSEGR